MKVNLVDHGAPELPEGYLYRVSMSGVHENRVDVQVSLLSEYTKRVLNLFSVRGLRLVGRTTISVPVKDPNGLPNNPFPAIVEEARLLYQDHIKHQ